MNRKLLLLTSGGLALVAIYYIVSQYSSQKPKLIHTQKPVTPSQQAPGAGMTPQYSYQPPTVSPLAYPQLSGQNPPTDEDMRKWKAYTDELSKRFGPDWVAPLTPIPPAPTLEAYPSTAQTQ